ncbi:MAG: hypothetical protein ACRCXM_05650 [Beijerinckiaceae bacterium]
MPKSALVAVAAMALLALTAAPVEAASPYGTGIRQAKKRHVSNPQCYAQVFERYAVLNRRGRWAWPSAGRRSAGVKAAYRHELFQQCGISA